MYNGLFRSHHHRRRLMDNIVLVHSNREPQSFFEGFVNSYIETAVFFEMVLPAIVIGGLVVFFICGTIIGGICDAIWPQPPPLPVPIETLLDRERPVLRSDPSVAYTMRALKAQRQGTAIVRFTVGKGGKVRDFKVSRPLGFDLDESIERAVASWDFDPTNVPVIMGAKFNWLCTGIWQSVRFDGVFSEAGFSIDSAV